MAPDPGDKAPAIKLQAQSDATVQIEDVKGRTVLVFFHPGSTRS